MNDAVTTVIVARAVGGAAVASVERIAIVAALAPIEDAVTTARGAVALVAHHDGECVEVEDHSLAGVANGQGLHQ